jgi:cathepsin D
MKFTPAFVLASLPFLGLVSGAAVESSAASAENRSGKVSVDLNKRSRLVKDNGVVNVEALKAHVAYATSKIEKGFEAFERNTGARHPLASTQVGTSKRKVGNDALTDSDEELWYGSISVGTPAVKYSGRPAHVECYTCAHSSIVDFDTGSSDLFLPASNCGTTCSGHTSKALGKSFSLAYGDGSAVSGKQYSDTVSIAGLTATKQTLGSATKYSTGFESNQFPADGRCSKSFVW